MIYSFPIVREIVVGLVIGVYLPASGHLKSGYKMVDNLEVAKSHSRSNAVRESLRQEYYKGRRVHGI